ncbi:MAG: tRNA (N6-isopentenyl adenosine(37)-C2)-methylthiotransferase MiaB [Pelagibacterales bacterium]|nr:tRNA (N6-isopentenyl adenosine(37)-C2)-methylthiotransferase MiaB [Pelagibacterales bacterium]
MKKNKIYIKSYGCQMNVYDSNRILDLFKNKNYERVEDPQDANLVVLNTCHIREKAAEKVYSDIGRIDKIKKNKSKEDYKLVIAGCVAQAEGKEIKKRAPSVDFVVGPQSYHNLPDMLDTSDKIVSDEFTQNDKFKNLLYNSAGGVSEFVSIQEGCDKFCSFCVVPYTRGPEFSRPVSDIIVEIKKYVTQGVKEIIFLGQNVNAYHGIGIDGKSKDLAYLVNKVSEIENLSRIRYMTSHPIDMTDSLIKVHKTNHKLMPFLHLPIQSGSDKILKDMNRKHTVDSYKKIVNKLRNERPDIALSSDFIVGYPNETDRDFEETMKFVDDVEFVIAYSFMYSQRPGTPAQKKDNVPLADKKARLSALQSLLKEQQKKFNKSFVGSTMEILFEKKGRYQNQYIGRSIYNQSVFTKNDKDLTNTIKKVKIINSTDFALESSI